MIWSCFNSNICMYYMLNMTQRWQTSRDDSMWLEYWSRWYHDIMIETTYYWQALKQRPRHDALLDQKKASGRGPGSNMVTASAGHNLFFLLDNSSGQIKVTALWDFNFGNIDNPPDNNSNIVELDWSGAKCSQVEPSGRGAEFDDWDPVFCAWKYA